MGVIAAAAWLGSGCTGAVQGAPTDTEGDESGDGDSQPANPVDEQCEEGGPGKTWTRRLTRFEYNNTVRDLLGVDLAPANDFPTEAKALGYDTNTDILLTTPRLIEAFTIAAEKLADASVSRLGEIMGSCSSGTEDEACAATLIDRFGRRAFRRPLEEGERTRLLGVYRSARQVADHKAGLRDVIATTLMSAPFLYRPEVGIGSEKVRRPTSFEMASRLSYFLWATMPDGELLDAAERGELERPEEIAAQAERLIDDPRAAAMFKHFYRQWLQFESPDMDKDPSEFPSFDEKTRTALFQASGHLFEHLGWKPGATLTRLFTEPVAAMDGMLAKHLGGSVEGTGFEIVRNEGKRSGILTDPGILAKHAGATHETVVTPILRGKWVQTQLLCVPIPPPPPDVPEPPPVDASATMRERLSQHRDTPACASCHAAIDPIGLALEPYDVLGRHRTTDRGLGIETAGEIILDGDKVAFPDVSALGKKLAESDQAVGCVATQWMRFSLGRAENDADACALEHIRRRSAENGHDIRELVLGLTDIPQFQYISAESAGGTN
jgi:hypothetical protein